MTFFAELKERPEEERAAFAATIAVSVVVVLVLVWVATLFLRGRTLVENEEVRTQTASAAAGFGQVIDQTSNAINEVSEQYKELQGKTAAVGAQGFATSTIDEATQNFLKIRYDENGEMYIEEDAEKSLLEEAAQENSSAPSSRY